MYIPSIGTVSPWMSQEFNIQITRPILRHSQLCGSMNEICAMIDIYTACKDTIHNLITLIKWDPSPLSVFHFHFASRWMTVTTIQTSSLQNIEVYGLLPSGCGNMRLEYLTLFKVLTNLMLVKHSQIRDWHLTWPLIIQ